MAIGGPLRVLVVEDQRLVTEMVKLTLNHGTYVTREAQDAGEATTILGEWEPHLAVIGMELGGNQLLHQIGSVGSQTGARLPAIALTRRGEPKGELAAVDQGAHDF